jgi:Amino-terminal Zinc-binding domain of ubiquitin ligase E3A
VHPSLYPKQTRICIVDNPFILFCRKREAFKQRIALYHQQLLNGCGNKNCLNKYCASCPEFCYKDLDSNSAAAVSIELMSNHAPLCKAAHKVEVNKPVAKADTDSRSVPCESSTAEKQDIPAPSVSSSCSASLQSTVVSSSRGLACTGAAKSDQPGKDKLYNDTVH